MRGRAVAARQAHNLKVSGSNPLPATNRTPIPVSFVLRSVAASSYAIRIHSPATNSRSLFGLLICSRRRSRNPRQHNIFFEPTNFTEVTLDLSQMRLVLGKPERVHF
jgi:hypothetical protein